MTVVVRSAAELAAAVDSGAAEIEIEGRIEGSPMITLAPGTTLRGGELVFGAKGVRLTRDNTLRDIVIRTEEDEVAILNDTSLESFGTLVVVNVRTVGQVLLIADGSLRTGHIQIESLTVERADVRGRAERPHGFGVEALQGALTVWNRQPDAGAHITAEILDVSIGTKAHPVRGSGVFVGGHGDRDGKAVGGVLEVSRLRTGEVHTDGGIPAGTPDLISGGVFVIYGAIVDAVENVGAVTTYGQNDMVLDNWGRVRLWRASAPVTSHGPSGIGFVNFGDVETLDVTGPIVTTGKGARGFNLYDGSLRHASFASIETTGDGSIGIQVSRPMGTLSVSGDVVTNGGEGMSLVKGVQTSLKAIALSVKDSGVIDSVDIDGSLQTHGDDVTTLEVVGMIGAISVVGGITAAGKGSTAASLHHDIPGLGDIKITSRQGDTVVRATA